MKQYFFPLFSVCLMAMVGTVDAQTLRLDGQPQGSVGVYPANGNSYPQGAQYDYARVINVVRVPGSGYASSNMYGGQEQRCRTRNEGYVDQYGNPEYPNRHRNDGYGGGEGYYGRGYGGSQAGRTMATVLGGVVGAVLGSQVGGGSARYATSALGSMVGGQVGGQIYDQQQRQRRQAQVTVCDLVPVNGGYDNVYEMYDVTYEYNNRRYTSRMNRDPGYRVRVRVDVVPE